MGRYTIQSGQNIYDVALHIYGSIEGIVDLLMSNSKLSMCDVLKSGDELLFTDDYLINPDVVAYMRTKNLQPANGERHVYYKKTTHPIILSFKMPNAEKFAEIGISGQGIIEIDWGDNSDIQTIDLSNSIKPIFHSFDNLTGEERKIRIYGSARLRELDFTRTEKISSVLGFMPIYLEKLLISESKISLDFIILFEEIHNIKLDSISVISLLPLLECKKLKMLDLSGLQTIRPVLDEYLIALVNQYYERRNCTITLTMQPSGEYMEPQRGEDKKYIITTGMEAIWVLTHEPAWNEAGAWKFVINDKIFTTGT